MMKIILKQSSETKNVGTYYFHDYVFLVINLYIRSSKIKYLHVYYIFYIL